MRHIVIRSIMALVWVGASVAGFVNGNKGLAIVYAIVGVVFGLNAWKQYKKLKEDGEN